MTYGTPPQSPQMVPASPAPTVKLVPMTLDVQMAPVNLPAGVSPQLVNWMTGTDGLSPRLGYASLDNSGVSSARTFLNDSGIGWLAEWRNQSANQFLRSEVLAMSTDTVLRWMGAVGDLHWNVLSYGTNSVNDPMTAIPTDAFLIYDPVADDNATVFCNDKDQTFIWGGPNVSASSGTYSSLTNAPIALTGCYFDDRLVFGAITDGGTRYPQRVQWSARGNPSIYTEPTGGFEELTGMNGGVRKVVADVGRVVIFGEKEIWAGYRAPFPFDFRFEPIHKSLGIMDIKTAQETPIGIVFQGSDANVYALPAGGSSPIPIGQPIADRLRYRQGALFSFEGVGCSAYDGWNGKYFLWPAEPTPDSVAAASQNAGYAYDIATRTWSHVSSHATVISALAVSADPQAGRFPCVWLGLSGSTVARMPPRHLYASANSSALTNDLSSTFSAWALFPIGNPNPSRKMYVDHLLIDYSNISCVGGSTLTVACSADFGQTYDKQVGVSLPQTTYSRQTLVRLAYSAVYPSIELRYESQRTGFDIRIQRITAMVEDIGQVGMGS